MMTALSRAAETPFTHVTTLGMVVYPLTAILRGGWGFTDPFLPVILAIVGLTAAALILTGIHWRGETLMGSGVEAAGLLLGAGVWLVYTIIIALTIVSPNALVALGFAIACLVRVHHLRKVSKRTVRVLRVAEEADASGEAPNDGR